MGQKSNKIKTDSFQNEKFIQNERTCLSFDYDIDWKKYLKAKLIYKYEWSHIIIKDLKKFKFSKTQIDFQNEINSFWLNFQDECTPKHSENSITSIKKVRKKNCFTFGLNENPIETNSLNESEYQLSPHQSESQFVINKLLDETDIIDIDFSITDNKLNHIDFFSLEKSLENSCPLSMSFGRSKMRSVSLIKSKGPTINTQQNLIGFKKFVEFVENHLKNEKNALGFIRNSFFNYFVEKYQTYLQQFRQKVHSLVRYSTVCEEAIEDLKYFLLIYSETLRKYYRLYYYNSIPYLDENNPALLNFLITFLFDEQVYSIVFELEFFVKQLNMMLLEYAFEGMKDFSLEDFGISKLIAKGNNNVVKCVSNEKNKETSRSFVFDNKSERRVSEDQITASFKDDCRFETPRSQFSQPAFSQKKSYDEVFYDMYSEVKKSEERYFEISVKNQSRINSDVSNIIVKKSNPSAISSYQILNEKDFEINIEDYFESVINLKNIKFVKSPIRKFKFIIKTIESLIDSILISEKNNHNKNDYKKRKIYFKEIAWTLIFVITKVKSPRILVHYCLAEQFANKNIKNSLCSYFLDIFKFALTQLEIIGNYIVSERVEDKDKEKLKMFLKKLMNVDEKNEKMKYN